MGSSSETSQRGPPCYTYVMLRMLLNFLKRSSSAYFHTSDVPNWYAILVHRLDTTSMMPSDWSWHQLR